MKKIIILFFFALILSGCGTTAGKMKKGKIQLGMSKDEFCMATVSFRFSRDPCSGTFMEGFNNTARGIYYPETQMEIMHDLAMEYFFVFNKVSKPFNYDTFKSGTGYLHKIFKDYEVAKKYAAKRDLNFDNDIIYNSKKGCEAEGLKAGTDEFAECTLKKIKELSK